MNFTQRIVVGMIAGIVVGVLINLTVADVDITLPTRFELSSRPWSDESVRVTLNGAAAGGWSFDMSPPAVVFDTPPPADEITFQEFHENTLLAVPDGVTLNGIPLDRIELTMDREVYGKLR